MTKSIEHYPPAVIEQDLLLESSSFSAEQQQLLNQIFYQRGIRQSSELSCDLSKMLSPATMLGIEPASDLLLKHIVTQRKILIVGDFDADGATSTALMVRVLKAFGVQSVDYLVPNRFEFGYGLSPEIVDEAIKFQPDLIITVDNGISSIDGVAHAKSLGIEVLVTDHHLAAEQLPAADAILNPNQPGCAFPSKAACGCTVAFYLLAATRKKLLAADWFSQQGIEAPKLAHYLDLLALATVADVVPLDHNNRIIVQQGLQRIRSGRGNVGIQAILQVAAKSLHTLSATDLGFALGPRLNAAGRLDDMSVGIECLLTDQPVEALEIAASLNQLNVQRKQIEQGMQRQAIDAMQDISYQQLPHGICLYQKDWHQGVVGILASRIKEKYYRPVIAFAQAEVAGQLFDSEAELSEQQKGELELKGSARSIPGLHIRDALDLLAKQQPDILQKFGGHAMAAGLSLKAKDYPAFVKAFDQVCQQLLAPEDLQQTIISDGQLSASCLNLQFTRQLKDIVPWGQGFIEPKFDGEFQLVDHRLMGQERNHLKLTLSSNGTDRIPAVMFNVPEGLWPDSRCKNVSLVYRLEVNEFRGDSSLQLMVDELQKC